MISQQLNNALRAEKSWNDVAGGLAKVLWGYALFAFGYGLAGALLYSSVAPMLAGKQPKIEHMWYFWGGVAVAKVSGLASWGLIIAGQFRCLMSSSERNGARWVIFVCLTCVVMGPMLHAAAWFGGLSTPVRWTAGPAAMQGLKLKFTMMGIYIMSASVITSVLYVVSFWYYLLSVAGCMGAGKAKVFVGLFPLLIAAQIGFVCYLLFGGLHANKVKDLAPYLGIGVVAIPLYWIAMIVVVKASIEQTMALVFNPMAEPSKAMTPQYELAGS